MRVRDRMIFVGAILVLLVAAFVVARRRRRLLEAGFLAITAGIVTVALAGLAISRDYRGASGFLDCWPSCSAFQDAVGVSVVTGPLMALAGLSALAVEAFLTRHR